MFTGEVDKIEFKRGRPKGARDKRKRRRRRMILSGIAGGAAVAGGLALARRKKRLLPGRSQKALAGGATKALAGTKGSKRLTATSKSYKADKSGQLNLFNSKQFKNGKPATKTPTPPQKKRVFKDKQGELVRRKSTTNPKAGFINRKNYATFTKKRKSRSKKGK